MGGKELGPVGGLILQHGDEQAHGHEAEGQRCGNPMRVARNKAEGGRRIEGRHRFDWSQDARKRKAAAAVATMAWMLRIRGFGE